MATKTSKATVKNVSAKRRVKVNPSFEQIQQRAYQIYVENGFTGNSDDHWLKAEKELRKR
ncbi:MAG: DUF2934 domain-containing protein [Bacteroidales bacterium]|jgi:hypothetical protein|nr:DUF2934 domain-containing protein [Bacteroidales bacterium]